MNAVVHGRKRRSQGSQAKKAQARFPKRALGRSSNNTSDHVHKHTSNRSSNHTPHLYKIWDIRQSESALVMFAQDTFTKKSVVIKKLHTFKDMRYSLETLDKRQQCQLEALHWNRVFNSGYTPNVYLGLTRVDNVDLRRKNIRTGDIIKHPTKETLESDAEYAVVMKQLQDEKRFDYLLDEENILSIQHYMRILIKRIVYMHKWLTKPCPIDPTNKTWGNFEQLQEKFRQNLDFLEYALTHKKYILYEPYYNCLKSQKDTVLNSLAKSRYPRYFSQRIRDQRIRRCHGDLKTPNILITPISSCRKEEESERVWLLDAIDFNPMFSNIDILSDFAMLAVDIEVRLRASSPSKRKEARTVVGKMLEDYLALTQQQDEVSRAVLTYYMLEKAIVSAAVSIVDDKLPRLSIEFLNVAEERLDDLKPLLGGSF